MDDELHGESIYEPLLHDPMHIFFHDSLHDTSKYKMIGEQLDGILPYNYHDLFLERQ